METQSLKKLQIQLIFAFAVVIFVIQDAYKIFAFPCLINGILTQHVSGP